jgi:predicted AlkP superfamily phosphohydrolase/phosphomutase
VRQGRTGPRLFIFGWDAADWAVIEAGWREGRIEHLRAIAERGQSGIAVSTIPPITPPAFTSFLTGTDPGEHGIFGFVTRGRGYEYLPVPGGARRVPTLIRRLDRAGYRTALVTFPYTYPAEPLEHGVVVPGWDDPEESFDSVHPPEAGRDLATVVPKVPRRVNIRAAETIMPHMREATELKERIARWAVDRADPHVFAMVFSETDHASHRWWVEGDPPPKLIEVYDLVDRTMGRLIKDLVHDDDVVLVVSDHGSWPIHHFVHIAPLLAEGGFLARSTRGAASAPEIGSFEPVRMGRGVGNRDRRQTRLFARMDWANTKAFPLGDHVVVTGVYLNCPPFPIPTVAPDEYDDVRAKVASLLSVVEDPATGGAAFATVAPREEVYQGPAVPLAPDLVLDGVPGIAPHLGRVLNFRQTTSEIKAGGHRREGMFAVNAPISLDQREPIQGLLPKLLRALSFEPAPSEDVTSGGYTAQEALAIEDRLRGLGYLE